MFRLKCCVSDWKHVLVSIWGWLKREKQANCLFGHLTTVSCLVARVLKRCHTYSSQAVFCPPNKRERKRERSVDNVTYVLGDLVWDHVTSQTMLRTQVHNTQDYRATQFRIFDGDHTAIKPKDADISETHDAVLNICWWPVRALVSKEKFYVACIWTRNCVLEIIVLEPQVKGAAGQWNMLSLRSIAGLSALWRT